MIIRKAPPAKFPRLRGATLKRQKPVGIPAGSRSRRKQVKA